MENPHWYGRVSGWQGDSRSMERSPEGHKDGKAWRAQGRCLRRATENERKKRRRWENRAEEVVTRYL